MLKVEPVVPNVNEVVEPGATNWRVAGLIVAPVAADGETVYPKVADTVQSAVMAVVDKVLGFVP